MMDQAGQGMVNGPGDMTIIVIVTIMAIVIVVIVALTDKGP
jgi:hypothetical protein